MCLDFREMRLFNLELKEASLAAALLSAFMFGLHRTDLQLTILPCLFVLAVLFLVITLICRWGGRLWGVRVEETACVFSWYENNDWLSGIVLGNTAVCDWTIIRVESLRG